MSQDETNRIFNQLQEALIDHAAEAMVMGPVPMGIWLGQVVVTAVDVWRRTQEVVDEEDAEAYDKLWDEMEDEDK